MARAKTKKSEQPIRMLILGTGGMAAAHAAHFSAIPGVTLVGGVDTRPEQLAKFCRKWKIGNRFASLQAALEWGQFDAVTNVTPDAAHHPTTMPVIAAGKHVMCEKPLATNFADAAAMAKAAQKAGVVNMVNLTYRNVAAIQKARALVMSGAIGEVRHVEASYLQSWLTQPAWGEWSKEYQWLWRLSTKHGSKGVLGDVGIHILDFATHAAGLDVTEVSARLKTFDKAPGGKIGEFVLDANDSATMQIGLSNGAIGTVAVTRFASGHLNDLILGIYGVDGGIEVTSTMKGGMVRICRKADMQKAIWREVKAPEVPTNYQRFIAAIRGQGVADPDFARGAALQKILDRAEQSAGRKSVSLKV